MVASVSEISDIAVGSGIIVGADVAGDVHDAIRMDIRSR